MKAFLLPLLVVAAAAQPSEAPDAPVPAASAAVRALHFTGWAAGHVPTRRKFIADMKASGYNAVAVALKDFDGHVFVKHVPLSVKTTAYVNAIPDLPGLVKDFEDAGIYTIARIAIFKDDHLAKARPDLAVKFPDGSVWRNDKGVAWVDPYKAEVWDYAIDIARKAAEAGFDEIQYDYIRFPSDGKTRQCRYSRVDHSSTTATAALVEGLTRARSALKPLGVKLSICTFGMTVTSDTGLGIGQRIDKMAALVDYVSPMMYPSHYAKGEYGLASPNHSPYLVIKWGLRDAIAKFKLKPEQLRPYLQDFSYGQPRYGPVEVRTQIRAAEELGVPGWILWNPQNRYSWAATQAGPIRRPKEPEPKSAAPKPAKAAPKPEIQEPPKNP